VQCSPGEFAEPENNSEEKKKKKKKKNKAVLPSNGEFIFLFINPRHGIPYNDTVCESMTEQRYTTILYRNCFEEGQFEV
jgi:hypothetical protein